VYTKITLLLKNPSVPMANKKGRPQSPPETTIIKPVPDGIDCSPGFV